MVFDHLEIHVSDLAASRAFYGEALPLTRNLHVGFGAESRAEKFGERGSSPGLLWPRL